MRHVRLFLALCLALTATLSAADEARFMRTPDINGNRIVFAYEGDLWMTAAVGGSATRFTTHPGQESNPKISPDGAWIAFTATYDGPTAVYVIPTEGGTPRRLTYNPGYTATVGWTPDSKRVVFRANFEMVVSRDPNLYFVDLNGGAPERFPIDRGTRCSFSSDGKSMLYTRKGDEDYYWKRYKGGQYQDIWKFSFETKQFTPVTDYVGKNSYPMWVGDKLYYVCDRDNGLSNLTVMDLTSRKVTPLTTFADFDVMWPSTDGKRIVFVQDGRLHLFDVASGKTSRLTVTAPSDRWALRNRTINPKEYLHSTDLTNDGSRAILEARGDVYVVPTGKGTARDLSASSGTREMYPRVSPDGKQIAFFSDRTGEYQIYLQGIDGGEATQLTKSLDRTSYQLLWSPDGKKILFGNKDYALFVLDVSSKVLAKIDESHQGKNDEFYWEIGDYGWSPDSRWVCYSQVQPNRNSQIFIYSLEQQKRFAVTNDFADNLNPAFDAAGGYLYFLSSRNFDVVMDFYEDNHVISAPQQVMAVQLRDGLPPPFADETKAAKTTEPFRIDTERLMRRTYPLPVPAGNFFHLQAGKGKILWSSVPKFTEDEYEEIFKPGGATKWDLHIFDMESKKEIVFGDKIRDVRLSANGEQMIIRREGDVFTTTVDKAFSSKAAGEKLDLGTLVYQVDVQKEWAQIFDDAWRWYRDFFYDPGMHGRDWKAMGQAYRAMIPSLSSRQELNWVLSQMVGELCVSHTYVGGGDMNQPSPAPALTFTGLLGAELVADSRAGLYKFSRIFGPTEYNASLTGPLARPDVNVREGDYLIAINGQQVKPPEDYWRLLQCTAGQKISITVNSTPGPEKARTYEIAPAKSIQQLQYFRWLSDNINYVLKASGGKVGYMHINAMGSGGIAEFDKFWRAFRYKEGLIIDVRRNSGGWTEYFMIDKLERKTVAYNVLRDKEPFRYPGSASAAHYVVVSNENNGSDGEAFVEHFKARKLGTVVGVPSWGGLVGILNAQQTVDNGSVNQSNNAFFGREGTWLVENHGADPDVVIDNDPASVMAGKDLQLDKAIEIALQKIKEQPFTFPEKPAYPRK
jgi:tricorn protease